MKLFIIVKWTKSQPLVMVVFKVNHKSLYKILAILNFDLAESEVE